MSASGAGRPNCLLRHRSMRSTCRSACELTVVLGDQLKGPTGVSFLPYLSGERSPQHDSASLGSFTGLALQSSGAGLTQAVLEGVAFAFRDSLEALKTAGTML